MMKYVYFIFLIVLSNEVASQQLSIQDIPIDSAGVRNFWKNFKESIRKSDTLNLKSMISFPLKEAQYKIERYDKEGLTKNEFSNNFGLIFSEHEVEKIMSIDFPEPFNLSLNSRNKLPTTDDSRYYRIRIIDRYEDDMGPGTFTTVMLFGMIEGQYKLLQIFYAG